MAKYTATWTLEHETEFEADSAEEAKQIADQIKPAGTEVRIVSIIREDRKKDDDVPCQACVEHRDRTLVTIHPIFRLAAVAPPIVIDCDPDAPGPRYA